ncbi:MAG: thioredoxin family protein [Thermodesulfobacteriota bacterium]
MKRRLSVAAVLFFLAAALFLKACYAPPPPPPPPPEKPSRLGPWGLVWHPYDRGVTLAQQQGKPVFIAFFTEDCRWCRAMEKDTYANRTVADYLKKNFVLVEVNTIAEKELRKSYLVRGVPSFCFLDNKGRRTYPRLGYMEPGRFLNIVRAYYKENGPK